MSKHTTLVQLQKLAVRTKGITDGLDTRLTAAEAAIATKAADADLSALATRVGANETAIATKAAESDLTALAGRVTTAEGVITTLNGDEKTDGSVKKQVADAVAKIVANAGEDFDTLKEIADWISGHADDASAMNSAIGDNASAISALETLVGKLPEGVEATTVVGYIQEIVEDLGIGDYATTQALNDAISGLKTEVTGNAETDTSASNTIVGAKKYADSLAGNYDKSGDAAKALADAKAYADGLAVNYDAAGAAEDVQKALLGADTDTAASNTIAGAKKYADSLVAEVATDEEVEQMLNTVFGTKAD